MTDFSDRLHEVFHDIAGRQEQRGEGPYTLISSKTEAKDSVLSDRFLTFDSVWHHKFFGVLRRKYRHQAGTVNPESYPEMHEKVKALISEDLINFYLKCVAAGMQVGEGNSMLVRRALKLDLLNDLFKKDDFDQECALQAMSWQDDYQARELLGSYLEGSAVALASSVGLPNQTDPEVINRAWDVWAVAGRSLMVLAYTVGERMGEKNKETDILKHAAKEMENNDDA